MMQIKSNSAQPRAGGRALGISLACWFTSSHSEQLSDRTGKKPSSWPVLVFEGANTRYALFSLFGSQQQAASACVWLSDKARARA
jgi:hypothetical protein